MRGCSTGVYRQVGGGSARRLVIAVVAGLCLLGGTIAPGVADARSRKRAVSKRARSATERALRVAFRRQELRAIGRAIERLDQTLRVLDQTLRVIDGGIEGAEVYRRQAYFRPDRGQTQTMLLLGLWQLLGVTDQLLARQMQSLQQQRASLGERVTADSVFAATLE